MQFDQQHPLAYFSAEYALFDCSQLYAGGLGILAGDYFLELAETQTYAVAIGLFYHNAHILSENSHFKPKSPNEMHLSLVSKKDGSTLLLSLPIENKIVYFRAWHYKKNNASLYLLDANVEENDESDKNISSLLYTENRDLRLKQEILLGIGGMKLLEALQLEPVVFHLNEGHSAFLVCELIAKLGLEKARQKVVFTNHTLIAAGNERFAIEAVRRILGKYVEEAGLYTDQIFSLGHEEQPNLFSMTDFALATASKINAVSKLHAEKAIELWHAPHAEINYVTNGIYIPRWDKLNVDLKEEISFQHQKNKEVLITEIQKKTGIQFDSKKLLFGWARRLVEYKQPLALFSNVERLKKLASEESRGFNIVVSGPVNKETMHSNEYIRRIIELSENELKNILVFIPEYDIDLSKLLVAGTDIWLNTPMVGKEACGTSGMKACLNGSLPLSTNDGWIAEVDTSYIGWLAEDTNLAENLYAHIEKNIMPLYYSNEAEWLSRMMLARKLIKEKFSCSRMLKDYIEKMYRPLEEKGI